MLNLTQSPGGVRIYDAQPGTVAIDPILINAYSMLTVPAYKRAMDFLSDNMASFPRAVRRDNAQPIADHPLSDIIDLKRGEPNTCTNSFTFWRALFFNFSHTGNGYARIRRRGMFDQTVTTIENVPPEDVWPFRFDRGDGRGSQQFYLLRTTKEVLPSIDVIHLSALSHDGMTGIDPVALHSSTFQRAAMLDRFQTKYLQNGTIVRGAIQIPQGVTKEQAEEVQATLRNYFRGASAERDVLVLSDGATLNNATLTPQQSQLVEQSEYTTKQISQITGVPQVYLMEGKDARYNNSVEQAGIDVVKFCFRPRIIQVEAELSLKLLTRSERREGLYVGLNPDALLRGDTKTQVDTLVATVTGRIRTPNEAREHLGLPKSDDPEADQLKAPGDTSPAERGAANDDETAIVKTSSDAPATPADTATFTVREAAAATGMSESQISKLASAEKIVSNGESGPARRVCVLSVLSYMKDRAGDEAESDEEVEQKFKNVSDE